MLNTVVVCMLAYDNFHFAYDKFFPHMSCKDAHMTYFMSHMTNLYILNVTGWITYDIFGLHMTNLMGIDIFTFTIFGAY